MKLYMPCLQSLAEHLARAEREIAMAVAESQRPHTQAEDIGILLWEMDWMAERERLMEEIAAEQRAA